MAKSMKVCPTSLIIRNKNQNQNKILLHIQVMTRAKSSDDKCWQGCREIGNFFIHCWWECKMLSLVWKIVWQFFRQLNTELPYDLAILCLGVYPREMKTYVPTKITHECL